MTRERLALASAALTAVCVLPYLWDMRRGITRPQRMSWFVFAALSVIAAVSQTLTGSSAGAWLAAGSAFGFSVVFIASLWCGEGGGTVRDRVVLIIAVLGVIVSLVTREPVVAAVAVVVAELVAIALTVSKTRRDPDSETTTTWVLDGVAGAVAVVAVTKFSVVDLLYPVHHTLVNVAVVAAIVEGRRGGQALRASSRSPRPMMNRQPMP